MLQVIDVDEPAVREDAAPEAPVASAAAPHAGHYVTPHDHRWQPPDHPRCSTRFWCATCHVWIVGPRCPVGRSNPLPKSSSRW
jgi:hypothetical protein